MDLSRRRFLDAAAILALASPLEAHAGARGAADAPEDAVAMADAVRAGRTTAAALVERAISRLEAANPKINCVAFPNFDRARARARDGVSGPLAGAPTLIKDNIAQKGLPNTNALRLFLHNVSDHDDPYVEAIERAGMISIGRSTLPELASNVTTESALTGITRNPWNLDYTSGGSSGGSSAAVAAGVVPVAHGNDYAGSLRHAAAPCGLIALKASRGRMAGDDGKPDDVTRQLIQGGLSRTVRDTAAWFAATEAVGPHAAFAPVGLVTAGANRRLKIGVQSKIPCNGADPDPVVQTVFDTATTLLGRLGHQVQQAPLAYDGPRSAEAYVELWEGRMARLLPSLGRKAGRDLTAEDIEPRLLGLAERGRGVSDARMGECLEVVKGAALRHAAQFDKFDVFMTPVFSRKPIRIGELGPKGAWSDQRERLMTYAGYCWIDNLAGTPAITLPIGMSPDGLPIGIQFSAKPGGERVLLELAYQLEGELKWWRRRPPVWVA